MSPTPRRPKNQRSAPLVTQDYRVELDAYSGPLDLLLYLVRRDEIDLLNIPIARLTEQYLKHLREIEDVDVNLAGEFLVMAATLLEIKSAMLLPRGQESEAEAASTEDSQPFDPRYELVQQLLAYKRFKDAAADLESRRELWQARFARRPVRTKTRDDESLEILRAAVEDDDRFVDGVPDDQDDADVADVELDDIHVMDLAEAYVRVMESIGQAPAMHEVVYDETPIGLHAEDILDRLGRESKLTLAAVFEGRSRSEAIGLFLAMLELVRLRKIVVLQGAETGEVQIEPRPQDADPGMPQDAAEKAADRWRNPETGEIDYDWPTDDARRRAERRAKLRATLAKKRFDKSHEAEGQANAQPEEDEIIDLDDDET